MPSELRIIRFGLTEVTAAVKTLAPRIKLQVPDTVILSAHAAPDGTANALLRYGEAGTGIVISNSQLAASLIAYCRSLKLPLPQEGQKSIQVSKENIDLRINMLDVYGQAVTALASAADAADAPVSAVHID
jgi:hypothetical protein